MRNSQLKPGYNIQIGIAEEYILHNNDSILNDLVSKMQRNIDEINKKDYSNEILLISNKVKKLNEKKQKLLDTYLDGILEKDEYLDKKQEIETKLIALDKEKKSVKLLI